MPFIIILSKSVLPIFIILAISFGYKKAFSPDPKQFANAILGLFIPAMVFEQLVGNNIKTMDMAAPVALMVILAAVLMGIGWVVAKLMRLDNHHQTSLILAVSMINTGNFGLPLIFFAYGEQAVAYSLIIAVAFTLHLSTVAVWMASPGSSIKESLKDVAKIPIFHALAVALIFTTFNIPVPGPVNKAITLLSHGGIPLMIFTFGIQLADTRIGRTAWGVVAVAVFIRLVISPLIAYPVSTMLGIDGMNRAVAVVQTSAPAALLPLLYLIRFGQPANLLATIILASTVLSAVSLPLVMMFLGY